jgi:hypothetical protein
VQIDAAKSNLDAAGHYSSGQLPMKWAGHEQTENRKTRGVVLNALPNVTEALQSRLIGLAGLRTHILDSKAW